VPRTFFIAVPPSAPGERVRYLFPVRSRTSPRAKGKAAMGLAEFESARAVQERVPVTPLTTLERTTTQTRMLRRGSASKLVTARNDTPVTQHRMLVIYGSVEILDLRTSVQQ
jgi:hypothetical protein